MLELLDTERCDEHGHLVTPAPAKPCRHCKKGRKQKKKTTGMFPVLYHFKTSPPSPGQTASGGEASDNDGDFSIGSGSDTETDADTSEPDVTNKEVST